MHDRHSLRPTDKCTTNQDAKRDSCNPPMQPLITNVSKLTQDETCMGLDTHILKHTLVCTSLTRQAETEQDTVVDDRQWSERASLGNLRRMLPWAPGAPIWGKNREDVAVLHGLFLVLFLS